MTVACTKREQEKADWALFLRWARCERYELGYGVQPGKFSNPGELEFPYRSIIKGLENFENDPKREQLRWTPKVFNVFTSLEFEVQSRSLLGHFSPEALRGKNPIQYRELFLRYAHRHPETIEGGKERQQCIDRLVELQIIRREWYDSRYTE